MKTIPVRKISNAELEPHFVGNFDIRRIESVQSGKEMVQELHRHDYFFVMALTKGKGKHIIDFTSYKISDRSLFFMCPGQVHELTLEKGAQGFILEFTKDFYYPYDKASNMLLRNVGIENFYKFKPTVFNNVHAILASMFLEHSQKKDRHAEAIRANLRLLLIELTRCRQLGPKHSEKESPLAQERMEELRELLETHIAKRKQVSDYANMMNVSLYQLNAITKRATGKTCSDVIDEHIILEAKRYLLATPNQVNQIAYHLGYEDASYFIRFFKKHTGSSPDAFRQNFK